MVELSTISTTNSRADALLATYERAGYTRVQPAILQPAEPFLDLAGEDIRRRLYLTTDAAGREFCLRPDLTIPVVRDYLASPAAGRPANFCYLGPVFRQWGETAGEFLQAGIESFGRADKAAADAEMLALALEAAAHYGLTRPVIRMGDVALFSELVAALHLAPAWKRRLVKHFNHKSSLAHDLERLVLSGTNARPEYQGVLAALPAPIPTPHGAGDRPVVDCRHQCRRRPLGRGDRRPLSRTVSARCFDLAAAGARALIERFLAIAGDPIKPWRNLVRSPPTPSSTLNRRSICLKAAPAFSPPAGSMFCKSVLRPRSAAASTITPAWCLNCTIPPDVPTANWSRADAMTACPRSWVRRRRLRRWDLPPGSSNSR